jgi:hypothetical protein
MSESKEYEYEPEFEDISAVSTSLVDSPHNDCVTDVQKNQEENAELGTLTWTWTPLSRDSLREANVALVYISLNSTQSLNIRVERTAP